MKGIICDNCKKIIKQGELIAAVSVVIESEVSDQHGSRWVKKEEDQHFHFSTCTDRTIYETITHPLRNLS